MERYTIHASDGEVVMDCKNCPLDGPANCNRLACRDRLKYRLAAYEDTGWTPEDISEKKAMLAERFVRLMSQELGMTQECLRDIVAAHLDGRLVVLPILHGAE